MAFCVHCGQMQNDGTRFCRFCGGQQPGDQLIARLRMEAESIRYRMQQMQAQQMQAQQTAQLGNLKAALANETANSRNEREKKQAAIKER